MPNLLNFDPAEFVGFFFIFSRISGLMLVAPGFSDAALPNRVRVAFVFILSLILFPVVARPELGSSPELGQALVWMLGEVLTGMLLGFTLRLAVAAVELAGEVIGLQMGLGIAGVFNPVSGQQVSLISRFQALLAVLLLFIVDGHHWMLEGLVQSYRVAPVGALSPTQELFSHYLRMSAGIFIMALKIGAPLIAALLAANVAVGLIARAAPQTNMFIVAVPFTIALGLAMLALSSPFFVQSVMQLHHAALEALLGPWSQSLRSSP